MSPSPYSSQTYVTRLAHLERNIRPISAVNRQKRTSYENDESSVEINLEGHDIKVSYEFQLLKSAMERPK